MVSFSGWLYVGLTLLTELKEYGVNGNTNAIFFIFLDEMNSKWRVVVLMTFGDKTNAFFFVF